MSLLHETTTGFQIYKSSAEFMTVQQTDTSVLISGIASVNTLDRSAHITEPTEFNLESFKNSPSLYFNHKFIKDAEGNEHLAGIVKSAIPVTFFGINPMNKDEYILKNLTTGDFVSTWPLSKSPDASVGSRALFVLAEVKHPLAIEKVVSGEMQAFSWHGLANLQKNSDGTSLVKNIDLIEVSLVYTPDNNQSPFRIIDENHPDTELTFDDVEFVKLGFNKKDVDLDNIKRFAKSFSLSTDVEHDAQNYFLNIGDPTLVDMERMFAIPCGDKTLFAAPKKEKITTDEFQKVSIDATLVEKESEEMSDAQETKVDAQEEQKVPATKLYFLDIDTLKRVLPTVKLEFMKSGTMTAVDGGADIEVEIEAVKIPVEDVELQEESKEEEATEEVKEEAEATTETTEEVKAEESAEETKEENKEEASSEVEALLNSMVDKINALEQQNADLQSKIDTTVNEKLEKVAEVQKAAKQQESAIASMMSRLNGNQRDAEEVSQPVHKGAKTLEPKTLDQISIGSLFEYKGGTK
jgi:hypothetical protein